MDTPFPSRTLVSLVAFFACCSAVGASDLVVKAVDPLVFLDGHFPVACGFAAKVDLGGRALSLDVVNRKTEGGSEFAIGIQGAGPVGSLEVSAGEVKAGEGFSPLVEVQPGRFERSRAFSPDDGAMFIQVLMVSGGLFNARLREGGEVSIKLEGPLPQGVRASYLNCAGDLVRPEG